MSMIDERSGTKIGIEGPSYEVGKPIVKPIMMNRAARRARHSVLRRGGDEVEAQKAARATLRRG